MNVQWEAQFQDVLLGRRTYTDMFLNLQRYVSLKTALW